MIRSSACDIFSKSRTFSAVYKIQLQWLLCSRARHSRDKMYIGYGHLCLSLATLPRYCTHPDVSWGNGTVCPLTCALLGGLAICAQVSLLWQHSAECEMAESSCTCCMPGCQLLDCIAVVRTSWSWALQKTAEPVEMLFEMWSRCFVEVCLMFVFIMVRILCCVRTIRCWKFFFNDKFP